MKLWISTERLSCDPVMICAKNQKEALKLLKGTLYETEAKYFKELFLTGGTEIEQQVCNNLTLPGVWKVERNRMYGLPKNAAEYVLVRKY